MAYDPRVHGADCDRCILRGARVVPPESHPGATLCVVGAYPGEAEEQLGRPLVGPSGGVAQRALVDAGGGRKQAHWTQALLCRPSKPMEAVRADLRRQNIGRAARGEKPRPDPITACRPRLLRELQRYEYILPLGKEADRACTGTRASILDRAGNLIELYDTSQRDRVHLWKIVPTVNPAYVLRRRSWYAPFARSVARLLRWQRGALDWREADRVFAPTPAQLREFLAWAKDQPILGCDTETDGIEPLTARMRCIQIGSPERSVVVPFLSRRGGHGFYSAYDLRQIRELIHYATCSGDLALAMHNRNYDHQVIAQHLAYWYGDADDRPVDLNWWVRGDPPPSWHPDREPRLRFETMIGHHIVAPSFPHGLGFVGAYYTDISDWKADHTATDEAQTDQELWLYGAKDAEVTAAITEPLAREIQKEAQQIPYKVDVACQRIGLDMHRIGIRVDQERRAWWDRKLRQQEHDWRERCAELVEEAGITAYTGRHKKGKRKGEPLFNPLSTQQLGGILFEHWDLPPPENLRAGEIYTSTEARSTGDVVLRAYAADPRLDPVQTRLVEAIRQCRRARKLRATYVVPLAAPGQLVPIPKDARDEEAWLASTLEDEHSAAMAYRQIRRMVVWPDGRLRTGWNSHVTNVGRFSSSSPFNMQNVKNRKPYTLRDMFVPAPGNVFVGADLDQAHLKIIANRWQIPSLIQNFVEGDCPHATFAEIVFGERWRKLLGPPPYASDTAWGRAKPMRDLGKTLRYTGAYGASTLTIFHTMTRAEDAAGNLTNKDLRLRDVKALHMAWMEREPEWQRGWDAELATYRRQGFLDSPIAGRRCRFDDEESDRNKILNYCTLAAEGDFMQWCTREIVRRIPYNCWGPNTGLIGQFHDAFLVECPESKAEEVAQILEETMNQSIPGWEIPFTAKADIGKTWADA